MAIHDIGPSFVKVRYHSSFGAHRMLIPTRAWNPLGGTFGNGGFEAWDSSDRDADDMVKDLLNQAKGFMPATVSFDDYTIFTKADPTAPVLPRAFGSLAIAGTVAVPGYAEATQATFSFFDTEFQTAKLVFLDVDSTNNFDRVEGGDAAGDYLGVSTEFANTSNAWSSRAGNRPSTLRAITFTLNEKLRREYRQT